MESVVKVFYKINLSTVLTGNGAVKYMHGPLNLAQEESDELSSARKLEGIHNEKGSSYITESGRLFPLKEMTFYTDQKV